jgi:hypothetical protein
VQPCNRAKSELHLRAKNGDGLRGVRTTGHGNPQPPATTAAKQTVAYCTATAENHRRPTRQPPRQPGYSRFASTGSATRNPPPATSLDRPPVQTTAQTSTSIVVASCPLSLGTATAADSALAPSHGSRLLPLRLPLIHSSAAPFLVPPKRREVFTGFAEAPWPPRTRRSFCTARRRLSLGGPQGVPPDHPHRADTQ